MVSAFSMLVCCFSLALRSNARWLALFTLVLSVVTLGFSRSATSALAAVASLAAAACLAGALRSGPSAKMGVFAALAVVAIPMLAVAASPESISDFAGRDATLTGRTLVWAAVRKVIDQSPFWGQGYGFWIANSPERAAIRQQVGFQVPHSHNSWLDVWLQLGVPGLAVLSLVCLLIFVRGSVRYIKSSDPSTVFSLAVLMGLLVRSIAEVEFSDPFPSGFFWLALAWGCLSRRKAPVANAPASVVGRFDLPTVDRTMRKRPQPGFDVQAK